MKKRCAFVKWSLIVLGIAYSILFNYMFYDKKLILGFISTVHETYIAMGINPLLSILVYPIRAFVPFGFAWLFYENRKFSIAAAVARVLDIVCMFYCFADNIFEKLIASTTTERLSANPDGTIETIVVKEIDSVEWQIVLLFDVVYLLLFLYRIFKCPEYFPGRKKIEFDPNEDRDMWSDSKAIGNECFKDYKDGRIS